MKVESITTQPSIQLDRFVLRPLRKSDAGLISHYAADERVARMTTSIPHPLPPGAVESYVERSTNPDRHEDVWAIDDSEFLPLLECVLTAFESCGLDSAGADELWGYAYRVYDRACREADPSYGFEENRDMMRGYLCGPRRLDGDAAVG